MEDWTYIKLSVEGTIRVRGIDRAALYEGYGPKTVLQTLYNDGTDLEVTVSGLTEEDAKAIAAGRKEIQAQKAARSQAKLEKRAAMKREADEKRRKAEADKAKKEAELADRARRKAAKRGEETPPENEDLPVGPAQTDEEAQAEKMANQQVEIVEPKSKSPAKKASPSKSKK